MKRILLSVITLMLAATPLVAQTVTVTPNSNFNDPAVTTDWYTHTGTCGAANTSSTSFVVGPDTPPAGDGSVQVNLGADPGSYIGYRTERFDGTLLSAITALSYSTYIQSGDTVTAPYMTLSVDIDNDGDWDDTLYFEPEYQFASGYANPTIPDQGDLVQDTWQTWNALTGGWRSANNYAGTGAGGADVRPLSTIIAAYTTASGGIAPRLTVDPGYGALRILSGCAAGSAVNQVMNFDRVVFNNFTFDFEPVPNVTLDLADVTQAEGDSGTTPFNFTVTLSEGVSQTVTVQYTVTHGTTEAGDIAAPLTGTVTFAPFDTTETITVNVVGDLVPEGDETFNVVLSSPTNATIADGTAVGTIVEDDEGNVDVGVRKTVVGRTTGVGGQIHYQILVSNNGANTATNVVVTDPLPAGTTLVSVNTSVGTCTGTTTITCTIPTLLGGANAMIDLFVTAPAEAGTITNTATVSANEVDFNAGNTTSAAAINVAATVPTASEWGLIALGAMLIAFALLKLR